MSRTKITSGLMVGCLLLSGCSSWGTGEGEPALGVGPGMASGVQAPISPADAQAIASAAMAVVTQRVPAGSGPLHLVAAPGDQVLAPVLTNDLQTAGYTLAEAGASRHRLSYDVSPLASGVLVRIDVNGARAARLFNRERGALAARGPFTVLEVAGK